MITDTVAQPRRSTFGAAIEGDLSGFSKMTSESSFSLSKGKVAQVLAGITQYKKDHPEVKISFTTESGWFKDTINIKFEGSAEAVLAASKSVDKMKNA